MRQWSGAVMAVALVLVPAQALAQQGDEKIPWKASPERGQRLAERLCASCHIVSGAQGGTTVAGIPSLEGLANLDTMSRARVRNALIVPHAPMPDMQMTMNEIDDIIAYLERLAGGQLGGDAAGQSGPTPDKPKYPSPT